MVTLRDLYPLPDGVVIGAFKKIFVLRLQGHTLAGSDLGS
jgi:hypothetical protein